MIFRTLYLFRAALAVCVASGWMPLGAQTTRTVNFDSVDTSRSPYTVNASSYLAGFGITLTGVTAGTTVDVRRDCSFYGPCPAASLALSAPSAPNLLTQNGSNQPVSFTLNFSPPVSTLKFTRPKLLAGPNGIIFPEWSATAYDSSGGSILFAREPFRPSFVDVPAATFEVSRSGISQVRFDSDSRNIAAFSSVVIDDLILSAQANPVLLTVAGNGIPGFSGDGGPAAGATVYGPIGVAVDAPGNLFIADRQNFRVRKISLDGIITTVAGNGSFPSSGDGGAATSAGMDPWSLAVDKSGNLYICDRTGNRVRKVAPSGVITTVAGTGAEGFSGDGGLAVNAALNHPEGIALDTAGNLYIADSFNQRIRKVAPNGVITTVAGSGTAGTSGDGGLATNADFRYPSSVAVDAAGALYISDSSYRVRKVTASGTIATVAGNGTWGYSGDGGPATAASISPMGSFLFLPDSRKLVLGLALALDSAGNLYIAGGGRIRKVTTNGIINTVAGNGDLEVLYPLAMAADGFGNVYVSDDSNRIREVVVTGKPTIAGVTNALSYAVAPLAPGSLVSIFGGNLSSGTLAATTLPLDTTLNSVQVRMNGVAAPLYFVSPTQINVQIPWELAGATTLSSQVIVNGDSSNTLTARLANAAPGTVASGGSLLVFHASNYTQVTAANPARPGEFLIIYCTGLGAVSNPPKSGAAAPSDPLSRTLITPVVTFGGVPATVSFSGLTPEYVGLYQINVQVPAAIPNGASIQVGLVQSGTNSNSFAVAALNPETAGAARQLAGAFNFPGPYPMPVSVTYNNASGQTLTVLAYPGQVFLAVSPEAMDATAANSLIATNRGTVIAQIPTAGLYWVQTGTGAEARFISAVQGNPAVILAGPNVPLTASQSSFVNLSGRTALEPLLPHPSGLIVQFDLFAFLGPAGKNVCGLSHGEAVDQLLIQNQQTKTPYDATQFQGWSDRFYRDRGLFGLAAGSDIGIGLERVAEGALSQRHKLIVNLSLQAGDQPSDGRDRRICETNPADPVCSDPFTGGTYASWKTSQFSFLVGIASTLQQMPAELLDNTLVVISSGNSGLNLTREIALLQSFFPKAFAHMLLVAATDANGQPFAGFNHTNSTRMLYAPGVGVPIPGTGGCKANGTSFAAPQVANLASQLAGRFPNLTTAELVQAILAAGQVQAVNGLPTMPTVEQAANIIKPPPGPLKFTAPSNLPPGAVGTPYSFSFCTPTPASTASLCGGITPTTNPSGGAPPYRFQLDTFGGFPPFGLSLNLNGLLTGTPSAAGTNTFRVCAVDSLSTSSCQAVSITVPAATGGIYTGSLVVAATATSGCRWNITIDVTKITAVIAGSGTAAAPYTGTVTATAVATEQLIPGTGNCPAHSSTSPLGPSGRLDFASVAPVSGSAGTVEWHKNDPLVWWDFTGGTFIGNQLRGTLSIDATPVLDQVVLATLTLTRQ